jgi:hypothetical protein
MLKRGLIIGGIAAAGYQGFRVYKLAKAAMAMKEPLKEYLSTQFGEEPKLICSVEANLVISVSVTAKFNAEILDKYPDIDQSIMDYIAQYYPILFIKRLTVKVYDKDMSTLDLIREQHPKFYKYFGKLIEKKLQAAECCKESAEDEQDKATEPSDL